MVKFMYGLGLDPLVVSIFVLSMCLATILATVEVAIWFIDFDGHYDEKHTKKSAKYVAFLAGVTIVWYGLLIVFPS